MIVENEETRTREYRARMRKRVEQFESWNAPQIVIDHYKELEKMSYREYQVYVAEEQRKEEEKRKEYYKTHKMDETVVKNLFARFDEISARPDIGNAFCDCSTCFDLLMDPLQYMSQEDYDMDLYGPLLDSLQTQLFEKLNTKEKTNG